MKPPKPRKPRRGRPRIPKDVEFQIQLSAYVDALPGGIKQAAEIIHMTPKIITYWLDGKGNPPYPTKAGVLALLAMAIPDRKE